MSTENQNHEDENQPSVLNMPDDEAINFEAPMPPSVDESEDDEEEEVSGAEGEAESDEDTDSDESADDEATEQTDSEEEESDEADTDDEADDDQDADESDDSADADSADDDASEDNDDADDKDSTEEDSDTDPVDPKTFFEKVTAPFKANGQEMKIQDPDDVIRLMQMGANYNKKMGALKPNLKMLKMLEKHKLLDEGKLGYLIDLDKKNPAAIAKLIKDSGIDPMDLEASEENEYEPNTYTVDDREVELDDVISEIQDSPHYNNMVSTIRNKWDEKSKQTIANAPQLLKVINDHMASGVYDLISTELERERMLGRLDGMTDIEAYRQVGDRIQAEGGFNHLFADDTEQRQPRKKTVEPKAKKPNDDTLKTKKRAASPPRKSAKSKGASDDFNPLALSDEDFEKQMLNKLL